MMRCPGFTLTELVVSVGLFMVAISLALVATVGTNSLISRTDFRSTISESARSVSDSLRRVAQNAPVGAVVLQGYYNNPDAFAGVQVKAFSKAQAQNTCEVVGRATAAVDPATKEEMYTLSVSGDSVAYWVYRVDSALQCPNLTTKPLYQNRLTSAQVRVTSFALQMNSYDCDASANCATKQQLRYSFNFELAAIQSGRAKEGRASSVTVASSLPIGLVGTGLVPVNILTTELPNGAVGSPYSKEILGEGGKLPYVWGASGNLASFPGLTLAQHGNTYLLSGTPANTGVVNIVVTLGDSSRPQLTDTQDFSFTINDGTGGGGVVITTVSLPGGSVGTSYSRLLSATGGEEPYTWSLESGVLPPGLRLSGLTGSISGTPTTPGRYDFVVKVADSLSQTDTQALTIVITDDGGGGCDGQQGGLIACEFIPD